MTEAHPLSKEHQSLGKGVEACAGEARLLRQYRELVVPPSWEACSLAGSPS